MNNILRKLSIILLSLSVISFVILWKHDIQNGFQYDTTHLRMGSPPFIFIGLAFIAYQLGRSCSWHARIKGLLLGAAFALWGSEQFLPATRWLTLMDNLVIGIFVVDLGIIVAGQLFKKE
ncbi:MAG: hypothetical protein WCK57_04570 [Verrucomicrobiae bacterium]